MRCYGLMFLVTASLVALTKASRHRGDMPILNYLSVVHPPCYHRNYVANANRMFTGNSQSLRQLKDMKMFRSRIGALISVTHS